MQLGLVSVVIPNYNYARYLRAAVDSVLEQTYREIEIIVVDDGSTDGSRKILDSYGERVQTIFQRNQGVSAARNNGVKASRGEFIAFLDADDSWLPSKIEKQVQCLKWDMSIGLVHVGVVEIDAAGNVIRELLDGGAGDVWRDLLMFSSRGIFGGGSGVMMRREIFDEAGGFDPQLSTSADWDLYFQVSSRHKVGFISEVLLRYRIHQSNMHSNIGLMEHDMIIAYKKAFRSASPEIASVRRRAYGSLHQNLAGSYFASREFRAFARHSLKSLVFDPRNIVHFLKIPKTPDNR